jgi:hypothetical protein
MSRRYEMRITVKGHKHDKVDDIERVLANAWPMQEWTVETVKVLANAWPMQEWTVETVKEIECYGEGNLCGGESEEEFTIRVSEAVWEVNEGFCEVEVTAAYLEDPPTTTHTLGVCDYARWVERKAQA